MSSTLTAAQSRRWLAALAEIQAALKLAEDIPGIGSGVVWKQVWDARLDARVMRDELLALVVVDVPAERSAA